MIFVVMELWQEILLAEEMGRAKAREEATIQAENGDKPYVPYRAFCRHEPEERDEGPSTKYILFQNRSIKGREYLIDKKGAGTVHSLTAKSTVSTFGLIIEIDEEEVLQKTFTELEYISDEIDGISTYYRDGVYVISVYNLKFNKSIKTGFYTTSGRATFSMINGKYEM